MKHVPYANRRRIVGKKSRNRNSARGKLGLIEIGNSAVGGRATLIIRQKLSRQVRARFRHLDLELDHYLYK